MNRNREEKFMAIEYLGLSEINGPLVVLEGVKNASYEEIVEFHMDDGTRKIGRIIEIYEDKAVIQVFEGTDGMSLGNTHTRLTGRPMEIGLSRKSSDEPLTVSDSPSTVWGHHPGCKIKHQWSAAEPGST